MCATILCNYKTYTKTEIKKGPDGIVLYNRWDAHTPLWRPQF